MMPATYYRLRVVRHQTMMTPSDLVPTLEWLVGALRKETPPLFALSGYSPAMAVVPVMDGDQSHIAAFVATSAIEYNLGREAHDPTHEVIFFNGHEREDHVYLRVTFVAEGGSSTAPGLAAELRLGTNAAGPADAGRGKHLERLFSYLLAAFSPDFGHLELPGHPADPHFPQRFDVGWITFLSRVELPTPPKLELPALVIPLENGTKIVATESLGVEQHADVARRIEAVRDTLIQRAPEPWAMPPAEPLVLPTAGAKRKGRFSSAWAKKDVPLILLPDDDGSTADVKPELVGRPATPFEKKPPNPKKGGRR